ncbi:hypothetical protein AB9F35_33710, partial [Rhizobium leguminosarum]|uniref:hypothetical protein n=1 Tax=Rhizobium leguminosarum TaxID=384 RepID=UPI003F97AD84
APAIGMQHRILMDRTVLIEAETIDMTDGDDKCRAGDEKLAQWAYDSSDHTRNIYYWYEGRPGD